MSRHRNIRALNVHDECEGMDDVYGHSFDDNYSVSPGTIAQFSFDRSRRDQLSNFLSSPEEVIKEEDELNTQFIESDNIFIDDIEETLMNQLNPIDQAKLVSCVESMKLITGDAVNISTLEAAAYNANFDPNLAINIVMDSDDGPKPQRLPRNNFNSSYFDKFTSKNDTFTENISSDIISSNDSLKNVESKKSNSNNNETKILSTPVTRKTKKYDNKTFTNELIDFGMDDKKEALSDSVVKTTEGMTKSASRAKMDRLDVQKEYDKRKGGGKDSINLVVIGHVDAGKSTLMGHLLFKLGFVSKKTMHKHEQEAKKLGKGSFAFAWVLDETEEERSRGVTMDVAQTRFETESKMITLIDAPGHKDFIPNMITGAAQADVAILVVNATRGEFETGFETGGQTREHALLARSLGVSQLLIAVNKMDTVDWSQDRFDYIVDKLTQFLRQAGFKEADLAFVPCSGLVGENLVEDMRGVDRAMWYTGPTLAGQIDKFKSPERPILERALRLCITDVFKGSGSGISLAGIVQAGSVQCGDKIVVAPSGETGTVKVISMDDNPVTIAFAGDNVVVSIAGIDANKVCLGNVLCDPSSVILSTCLFRARVVIFNVDIPITKGFTVVLHMQSLCEQAKISRLISQLHRGTGEVIKKNPKCLVKNTSAEVELMTDRPLCLELYSDLRELGRFMLRSSGSTIAAGVVTQIL